MTEILKDVQVLSMTHRLLKAEELMELPWLNDYLQRKQWVLSVVSKTTTGKNVQ